VRSWVYLALLIIVLGGLTHVVSSHHALDVAVLRAKDTPYSEDGSGAVVNHFKFHLTNRGFKDGTVTFTAATPGLTIVRSEEVTSVAAGQQVMLDAFLRFPRSLLSSGHGRALVRISSPEIGDETVEVSLVGPFK
jgi:hypothetical protein